LVGFVSCALRVKGVCRSNVYTESGENSVWAIGTDVSLVFETGKLFWLFVVIGIGVRERIGNVSANGAEPIDVGVLLRGLSKYWKMIDRKNID
jgi:hypothetical protein